MDYPLGCGVVSLDRFRFCRAPKSDYVKAAKRRRFRANPELVMRSSCCQSSGSARAPRRCGFAYTGCTIACIRCAHALAGWNRARTTSAGARKEWTLASSTFAWPVPRIGCTHAGGAHAHKTDAAAQPLDALSQGSAAREQLSDAGVEAFPWSPRTHLMHGCNLSILGSRFPVHRSIFLVRNPKFARRYRIWPGGASHGIRARAHAHPACTETRGPRTQAVRTPFAELDGGMTAPSTPRGNLDTSWSCGRWIAGSAGLVPA